MDDAAADAGGAQDGGAHGLGAGLELGRQPRLAGDGERAVNGKLHASLPGRQFEVLHQYAEPGFIAGGQEARQQCFGDHRVTHGDRQRRRAHLGALPADRHEPDLAVEVGQVERDGDGAVRAGLDRRGEQGDGLLRDLGQRAAAVVAALAQRGQIAVGGRDQTAPIVADVDAEQAAAEIVVGRVGRLEAGQAKDALVDGGQGQPGAGLGLDRDLDRGPGAQRAGVADGERQAADAGVDGGPGKADGAGGLGGLAAAEDVDGEIGAGSPGGVGREFDGGAAFRHVEGAEALDAVGERQQGGVAGERGGDVEMDGLARLVVLFVGRDIDLVGRVRAVGRHPAGAEMDRTSGQAAFLKHLKPVAPEVEPLREVQCALWRDCDVLRRDRLVAVDGLVAGERAAHDQAPVRPLAHQAQLGRHADALAVAVHGGDVEPGFAARVDGAFEARLDADEPGHRADRDRDLGVAGAAGGVVDADIDLGADRGRAVGGGFQQDRERRLTLLVGIRQCDLERIRRELLIVEADPVAGQRSGRGRVLGQMQAGRTGQIDGGRAVEEAGGDRQRVGLARDDRPGGRGIDGHPVRHESVDLEGGVTDRRPLGVGEDVDRPHAGRRR